MTKSNITYVYNNTGHITRENPRAEWLENTNTTNDCKKKSCDKTKSRVPFNHWRKTSNCNKNCVKNQKIIKDTSANACYTTQYHMSRLTDSCGFKTLHTNLSNAQYLQNNNRLWAQNSQGLISDLAIKNNKFNNSFHSTYRNENNYRENDYKNTKKPCQTIVNKYSNNKFKQNGAVSGRARINRLKRDNNIFSAYNCTNKNCGTTKNKNNIYSTSSVTNYKRPSKNCYINKKVGDDHIDC
jgi:hypothetical protein